MYMIENTTIYVLAHYALEVDGGAPFGDNAERGEWRGEGRLGEEKMLIC